MSGSVFDSHPQHLEMCRVLEEGCAIGLLLSRKGIDLIASVQFDLVLLPSALTTNALQS